MVPLTPAAISLIVGISSVLVICWAVNLLSFLLGGWLEKFVTKGELQSYELPTDRSL